MFLGLFRKREAKEEAPGAGAWLLVGLGNPGPEYEGTYHNLGRRTVQRLMEPAGGGKARWEKKFKGRFLRSRAGGHDVAALLPETYMNLSGESAGAAAGWLKIPPARVVVVHDDLDLPPGAVRVKTGGGDGGHKGVRSCAQSLGTPLFVRVRIGIGRHEVMDPADYVLSRIARDHEDLLSDAVARAAEAAEAVMARGVDAAMNEFNGKMG